MTTVQHVNLVQNGRRKGTERNVGDIGKISFKILLFNLYFFSVFVLFFTAQHS